MKVLVEAENQPRHAAGKRDHHNHRKSRKIMKKMAKLERKLSRYGLDNREIIPSSADELIASSSDREDDEEMVTDERRRHCSGRRRRRQAHHQRRCSSNSSSSSGTSSDDSCDSDASSSSSSLQRSPSPKPRGHRSSRHLSRSRSFGGRNSSSPARKHSRHQRQHRHHDHHYQHRYQDLHQGKHHHRRRHTHDYCRLREAEIQGCLYRNLAQSEPNLPELAAELSIAGDRQGSEIRSVEQITTPVLTETQDDPQEMIEQNDEGQACRGEKIDEDLAKNWIDIIRDGKATEEVQGLLEKYPIPENCTVLSGPKLNREIHVITPTTAVRRDEIYVQQQHKIGAALVALSRAITSLSQESETEGVVAGIAENLKDAADILLDVHRDTTKTRQTLILTETSRKVKAMLATCKADEDLLFGKDLLEKIKNVKGLENKYKKIGKESEQDNRHGNKYGKRKHGYVEGEKRKSKRLDVLGHGKK